MQDQQNIQVVKQMYEAFGRGDVRSLLEHVADDALWRGVLGAADYVPTSGERRGKAEIAEFFRDIDKSLTFDRFEPRQFMAADDTVVVLGSYAATTRAGGRKFASDWAMVFTLRDGLVSGFQEITDSAAINAAFQPASATT